MAGFGVKQRPCQPVRNHIDNGNSKVSPTTAARPRYEGLKNRRMGCRACCDVNDRQPDASWSFWTAGNRRQPTFGLYEEVVCLSTGIRPVIAIAAYRTGYQGRIDRPQPFPRKTQGLHPAPPHVLTQL